MGIGEAIASSLVKSGVNLILFARSEVTAASLTLEILQVNTSTVGQTSEIERRTIGML